MRKLFITILILLFTISVFALSEQRDGTSATDDGTSWISPPSALSNDTSWATTAEGTGLTSNIVLSGFSTLIPTGSTIDGIEIRDDGRYQNPSGGSCAKRQHSVSMSWDSGTNFTVEYSTVSVTTSEVTYTLGSSTDDWGHTWAVAELGNPFRLYLAAVRGLPCASPGISQQCEYLSRTVYYTIRRRWLISMTADINRFFAKVLNDLGLKRLGEIVYLLHPYHKKEIHYVRIGMPDTIVKPEY